MKTRFLDGFLDDLEAVRDKEIRKRIAAVIQNARTAESLSQIYNLKKLKGAPSYFRIRTGDFRIGFRLEAGTIVFMRCLPRKDIYRSFP